MSFTPKVWQNGAAGGTPVSAAALVDMETRLSAYTESVVAALNASTVFLVDAPTGVAATDLAAIQAQITAASAAGGGTVQLRPGTYVIAAFISLRSEVNLRGAGKRSTVIQASGAISSGVIVGQSAQTVTDSVVSDLTVDVNNLGVNGVQLSAAVRTRVRDCRIINCGLSNNGVGALIQSASSFCVVENCEIDNTENQAVYITGSTDCRVTGNTISNAGGGASNLNGIEAAAASHRTIIKGNRITGAGGFGIRIGNSGSGSTDCEIEGNIISGSTLEPIGFTADCIRTRVIGNHCSGGGDNGISCSGAQSVIANNTVLSAHFRGISCLGSNSSITGNVVKNSGQEGNSASGGNYAGIWVGGNATDVVITGNRCYDDQATKTQEYGIQSITGSDYLVVVGNNVRGNETGSITLNGANNVNASNVT